MIYTFYSYKGGVGRTMALANVAELFYRMGLKVLIIDWDLEAPGLERFFFSADRLSEVLAHEGIMDMLLQYKKQMSKKVELLKNKELPFKKPQEFFIDVYPDSREGKLWLLTPGKRYQEIFPEYAKAVLTFDWQDFYENWDGEAYLEWIRQQFYQTANVILIDSRTGVTEIGGVCTYHLADIIVVFCASNDQNIEGTLQMVTNFSNPDIIPARHNRKLITFVIPSRIDDSELEKLNEFYQKIIKSIKPVSDELEENIRLLKELTIPYVPSYAFEEILAVKQQEYTAQYHSPLIKGYTELARLLTSVTPEIYIPEPIKKRLHVQSRPVKPSVNEGALMETYLSMLMAQTSQIQLSGIDRKSASVGSDNCLQLSAIYVALSTRNTEYQEHEKKRGVSERPAFWKDCVREEYLSALDQMNRHQRLVLLGDPGSGKSTFVRFLVMCLTGELLHDSIANLTLLTAPLIGEHKKGKPQQWDHGALLPVIVILRDFAARGLPPQAQRATAKHLWQFIVATLEEAMLLDYAIPLQRHLRKQGGLILLDGLDEVPEAEHRREQIKQVVEDFAATFPNCRILVTSRTYAYQDQAWRLSGFADTVLAPLAKDQIRDFVDHWYAHIASMRGIDQENAQGRAELLKRAIFQSDRLHEFAQRPLLLTLMASLHAWRGGSLPEKRGELYKEAIELLFDWWEQNKVVRNEHGQIIVSQPSLTEMLKVGKAQVQGVLYTLAFEAHKGQGQLTGTADIPEQNLVLGLMEICRNAQLNPLFLVEHLRDRSGLLIPHGVGVYTFPHRSFQEYLAACYVVGDVEYPSNIAVLACADPNRWREVVLLAADSVANATPMIWALVQELCYLNHEDPNVTVEDSWGALLAGQVLIETTSLEKISPANQSKVDRIRYWLVAILTEQVPQNAPFPTVERALASNILAILGDPRPGIGLRSDGLPDIFWCEVPAGAFIMGSNPEDDKDAYPDEPRHEVWLPTYQIGRYPVTNTQYRAFIEDGGYTEQWRHCWTDEGWAWKEAYHITEPQWGGEIFDLPYHPVIGVSWYEATAFCQWLAVRLQQTGDLSDGQVIRLPGESEWEKSARGTDGRIYPWGNEQVNSELANYDDTGLNATNAVGCFPRGTSPYGCEEMIGNVWEWCLEMFPTGSDPNRLSRGGGWATKRRTVRCACRWYHLIDLRVSYVGFRLLRSNR